MQQLLTEALVIAVAGAALGVLIAWKGLALIVAWVPTNSFAAESVIEMNLPVLLFSTALAVVTRSSSASGRRCSSRRTSAASHRPARDASSAMPRAGGVASWLRSRSR